MVKKDATEEAKGILLAPACHCYVFFLTTAHDHFTSLKVLNLHIK